MDFTREPVIETVITPKEGCKLVIRNSKGTGQEEFFVDAVEVITFGQAIFFRSLERPKPFIVPASDYEVLEVRETRIVLKNVGLDRSIKIGGGREGTMRPSKEPIEEKEEQESVGAEGRTAENRPEVRQDRKRDRRRQSKRRREVVEPFVEEGAASLPTMEQKSTPPPVAAQGVAQEENAPNGALLASLLAPPPLVFETIGRYKEQFKDAFYTKEEQEARLSVNEVSPLPAAELALEPGHTYPSIPLEQPAFGAFELSEEAEEEIYRQRKRKFLSEESEMEKEEISSPPQEDKPLE